MSQQPINLSPDLQALRDDGYEISIKANYLFIENVPYVNHRKKVRLGTLVTELDLAGNKTIKPKSHVIMFAGEYPCDQNGQKLKQIEHQSARKEIGNGLVVDHSFSSKPNGGYSDYYHKITTYAAIISHPAVTIEPNATARTHAVVPCEDPDLVFNYLDTASPRAGINTVSEKLKSLKIGIVGLGGTGSYVLDYVAKTPVKEIHLFDGDDLIQHNAFRSPGAPSLDELKERPQKVDYWAGRYAPMRKNIFPHNFKIDETNVTCLESLDFVFICVDAGKVKPPIIEKLQNYSIPFIDVGMGIEFVDEKLLGILRVTTSTSAKHDHISKHIDTSAGDADGVYTRNIQIAELNALNAALAVIKWKKLFGFYLDLDNEHSCEYTLDGNMITNGEKI